MENLFSDFLNGKHNLILFIVIIFLLFHIYYKIDQIKEPMTETDISSQIKDAVKQIYMIDVDSIRNLSEVATKLQKEGLTIPGNLTVTGNINTNGGITSASINTNGAITLGKINLSDTENSLRIKNQNGFVDIGSKNNEWAHIYTDRPKFALNKQIADVQGPDSKNFIDYVKRSTNGGIDMGSLNISNTENSLRIKNESGFVDIGSKNSGWAHIYTDRPKFALNKQITDVQGDYVDYVKYNVDGGININNFKITTKDKNLIFNNKDNNKTIMNMNQNGSVQIYTYNGQSGNHLNGAVYWCDDKGTQCLK
jgi:hypothetical protein